MQSLGRRQISAPKASTVTAIPVCPASTSVASYTNGNTTITAAIAVAATAMVVAERKGFAASQVVLLGYGTDNEEEVTIDSGYSHATGAGSITISAARKAHVANEKVVEKRAAIVPGTLVVKSTATTVATDDGEGNLVESGGSGVSGTVNYSAGLVVATFGGASSRTITYNADKLNDSADINDQTGDGFMRNLQVMLFSPHDGPTAVVAKNLGVSAVGFIVEKSSNGGKSFQQLAGKSGTLSSLAKKALTLPALQGADLVRVRASAASAGAGSVLEVDTLQDISDNGQ